MNTLFSIQLFYDLLVGNEWVDHHNHQGGSSFYIEIPTLQNKFLMRGDLTHIVYK